MSLITQLFNLLYPPRCPSCGAMVAHDGGWCPACLAAIWHPRRINKTPAVRHLSACYCLTDYRGAMRHVLHDIKYNGKPGSAGPAGSCSTASPGRNGSPASTSSSPCRWHRKITAPRLQPGRSPLSRLGLSPLDLVRRLAAPAADESPMAAPAGRADRERPRCLCRQRNHRRR